MRTYIVISSEINDVVNAAGETECRQSVLGFISAENDVIALSRATEMYSWTVELLEVSTTITITECYK